MTGRVIQGFFLNAEPRLSAAAVSPAAAQAKPGPRPAAPPPTAFAPPASAAQRKSAPVGPPKPAFAPKQAAVAQLFGGNDAFAVDPARLGLNSSGGRALPDAVRGKMEAAFGADFSGVRVHVGPQAERVGAIAFTLGQDIYFAPGRFQPDTVQGQQLLGHELAHVVQQRQGRVRNPLGGGVAVVQDRALEAEADRLGMRAAAQAKMTQPVRISAPTRIAPGSVRLTADAGGREIGSVMVHTRNAATEVTDLNVAPTHRQKGVGRMLLASAARAGLQAGRARVTLTAQDNGSGRLTRWYRGLGFSQTGTTFRGYPKLEALAGSLLTKSIQRAVKNEWDGSGSSSSDEAERFKRIWYKSLVYHATREENLDSIDKYGLLNLSDQEKVLGEDNVVWTGTRWREYQDDRQKGVFFGKKDFFYHTMEASRGSFGKGKVRAVIPAARNNEPLDDPTAAKGGSVSPDDQKIYKDDRFRGGGLFSPASIPSEYVFTTTITKLVKRHEEGDKDATKKLMAICNALGDQFPDPKPDWKEVLKLLTNSVDKGYVSD